MAINWPATKSKFDEKYNQKGIARGMGIKPVLFCLILNGKYHFMESARAKAVVAKLDELGVLVHLEETANPKSKAA